MYSRALLYFVLAAKVLCVYVRGDALDHVRTTEWGRTWHLSFESQVQIYLKFTMSPYLLRAFLPHHPSSAPISQQIHTYTHSMYSILQEKLAAMARVQVHAELAPRSRRMARRMVYQCACAVGHCSRTPIARLPLGGGARCLRMLFAFGWVRTACARPSSERTHISSGSKNARVCSGTDVTPRNRLLMAWL